MPLEEDGPTAAHLAVLELLALDLPSSSRADRMRLSPKCIARSAGYKDSNHIGVVCRDLQRAELVTREDPGYYSITWRGKAYLEGELDASDLDVDEE
ncbi:hypothetical protein OB955_25070 [Halobacteria archaeon AArc-m2/3/4]|uniref:Uncharacterized protein n=1 Tax=Natronoglomus mannanivorans TaxID=2979990 RepID=A0ABT2QLY7_9EURY|nr:hypothetical protein [Halobacteria archaeon AArc-m2/3/4]